MSRSESSIQAEILREHRKTQNIRLYRNNVGKYKTQNGNWVDFGLKKGSSDLIGWIQVEITPEMIGQTVAVFASAEVKTATGKPSKEQTNWINAVNKSGGIAGIVRSMKDLYKLFNI